MVVTRAREIGASVIVTASTGNAGAALAAMARSAGQPAIIEPMTVPIRADETVKPSAASLNPQRL